MKQAPQLNTRAVPMQRILDNFPEELILRAQWVLWKLERRGDRTTKIPYQPNGAKADSADSATWSDFETAMVAFMQDSSFSGIGFAFSADDPYVGIDLDKCRDDKTGAIEPWAVDILKGINTYVELSPSGKGFHLIGKGKLPAKGRRKDMIEMYESGRYFTVTGERYGKCAATALDIQPALIGLHAKIFGVATKPAKKQRAANDPVMVAAASPVEDQAVFDKILASGDAERFKQFQSGDWAALGYPSQSEGDLALAGMLARHAGPHPEQIDRLFRTTGMFRDKWDEMRGTSTYGDSTVAKAVEGIAATDDARAEFMAKMNRRFAVIQNGNQTRILDEATDFRLLSKNDFQLATSNMYAPNTKDWAGGVWLHGGGRREYSGIVFSPGGDVAGKYNMWRGFSIVARPGDCSLYWQLVRDAICAGDLQIYEYVRRYFAHLIQRPGERPEVAIVLRGGQGTGKNTCVDTIGSLVSEHYCQINNVDQLTGRFNAHMRNVILMHANEATWGGNKSEAGKLKAMITDATIPIEMKGVDILHIDNYMRTVVSSNEAWPVPVEADDRRFLILEVSPVYAQNTIFFGKLHTQLNNGGREALMHDLLTEEISNFSPRDKPATPFGADMKIRSADGPTRWLYDCLASNAWARAVSNSIFTQSRTSISMPKGELFDDYQYWSRTAADRYPVSRDQFYKRVSDMLGAAMHVTRPAAKPGQVRDRIVVLTSIEGCRRAFGIAAGIAGAVVWDPL